MPVPKKTSAEKLILRITVIDPPPNIEWALQLGDEQIVKPTSNTQRRICFDFTVDVVEDSSPAGFRLRGSAVQGRPGLRNGAALGQGLADCLNGGRCSDRGPRRSGPLTPFAGPVRYSFP